MRVLLCGVGVMGANHLRVLCGLGQECTVAGIVEPSEERQAVARSMGDFPMFGDLDAALDQVQPDAVIVATPTVTHFDFGREVLGRGLPLFIEKPIARTARQGQELADLAREKRIPLMVGHVERFNPAVVSVHHLLRTGEVGDVLSFTARRVGGTPQDIAKAGDVLVDLAVHDIDIATWLLGDPELHGALGHRGTAIDCATLLFTRGETIIDIHVNWVTPVKIRELRVTGTLGHLDINLITQQVAWTKQNPLLTSSKAGDGLFFDDYLLSFATPDRIQLGIQRREPLREELRAFLAAMRSPDPLGKIPVTGEDGVKALRLAEEARRVVEAQSG